MHLPSLFRDRDEHPAFGELRAMMERAFGEPFAPFFRRGEEGEGAWVTPRVNLSASEDDFEVTVELPGIKREDVTINLDGRRLTIRGEHKETVEDKKRDFHRVERRMGTFMRALTLPDEVDPERTMATFADGLLTVTLQKAPEVKRRQREIQIR